MNDKFIVSVANALLIDEKTNTLVCKAKALIDSALKQELQKWRLKEDGVIKLYSCITMIRKLQLI